MILSFASFQAAWALSWHNIDRIGCEEMPALYRDQQMGPASTRVVCCSPSPTLVHMENPYRSSTRQ